MSDLYDMRDPAQRFRAAMDSQEPGRRTTTITPMRNGRILVVAEDVEGNLHEFDYSLETAEQFALAMLTAVKRVREHGRS